MTLLILIWSALCDPFAADVAALSSPRWATREAATVRLARAVPLSAPALLSSRRSAADPESLARLDRVLGPGLCDLQDWAASAEAWAAAGWVADRSGTARLATRGQRVAAVRLLDAGGCGVGWWVGSVGPSAVYDDGALRSYRDSYQTIADHPEYAEQVEGAWWP